MNFETSQDRVRSSGPGERTARGASSGPRVTPSRAVRGAGCGPVRRRGGCPVGTTGAGVARISTRGRGRRLPWGRERVVWRNAMAYAPLQGVDFSRGISTAWANVVAFVPKFVAFLVILIVGLLVAKILEKVLDKVLERVGFDRLVERGGVKQALARSRYDASGILGRILYYAVVLFTLSTAFGVFGRNPISDYLRAVIAYLPRVFAAVIILVVAAAIAAAVRSLVDNLLGGLSYGPALATLASAAIIFLGIIAGLNQLNVAANVVNALLYAVLAVIVGVVSVAA